MRHTRKCIFILMLMALSLVLTIPVLAQPPSKSVGGPPGPGYQKTPPMEAEPTHPTGPRLMAEDVYTPIVMGYDFIREGKYDAARNQFAEAVKRDPFNPFALNNLAVLDERDGKLNDALANLKDATTHADQYKDKVSQTCFVGGSCMAAKPLRKAWGGSVPPDTLTISSIIQDNIKKVEAKIAATKTPPPPGSPPPIMPEPKTKK